MKKFITRGMILSLMMLTTVATTTKADVDAEEIVEMEPLTLFIPVGFDNNDDVVAIVDGYLPDTCYRLRSATVETDLTTNRIVVQPKAVRFPGPCMDVVIPYVSVVHLGTLPAGKYAVATRTGKVKENLEVKRSSNPGPDDHLYAPVESAKVELQANGTFVAHLYGRFTSTCSKISEVKVINSGKTFEILPIMQQLDKTASGAACEKKEIPFSHTIGLPQTQAGRHLLHVRSLNGQSVNEVFTTPQ